jgi:DNA-directed RNA polymerase subunit K/omega
MPRSIFDREVFFKMEQMNNPFIAARVLSIRAREVNNKHKEKREEEEVSISAPALALEDYLEGRITFPTEYQTNSHER